MKKGAYIFDNEQDYNAFRDAVYYKNSTLYYSVDKVSWYGYSDGKYRVNLNDKLTDEELEWILICIKEYNGHPLHTHIARSKGTCRTTWQCHKCMTMITTVQEDAGFINGYGDGKLRKGPCAAGGDHDWHEITEREWLD
jgi:hypothetical protein